MQTPFILLQDDWIQIAPLGDHPHQLGIQRITHDSAAAMANRFNTFRARLGRLFSGVPMFEGHHDTDPEKYPNGRSFAWVMELQNRATDGLWAKLKWTDEGRALVTTGKYKFISPVWNAREVARENGRPIFIPETLLSLALTNLPNLPLPPLANEQQLSTQNSGLRTLSDLPLPPLANEQQHMNTITELLELPADASPDQIVDAVSRLKKYDLDSRKRTSTLGNKMEAGLEAKKLTDILSLPETATAEEICAAAETLANQVTTLSNESGNLRTSAKSAVERIPILENQVRTQDSELRTVQSALANERAARIELILANAITTGRITEAERAQWQTDLTADFDAKSAALESMAPKLNTTSLTRDLGNQKEILANEQTRRAELVAFLAEKQASGMSYDEAWNLAKKDRADIFSNMARG